MTKDRNQLHDDLTGEDGSGWLNRFLAEEDELDHRSLWRLGSWGVGSVAVLVVAILAARSPAAMHRDQLAAAEMSKQTQQVQWIAKESQNQTRQLAAAVDTLNGDRDRLYARVTVLEQGLDSVTGSLARPSAPAAAVTLPATTSATEQPQVTPPAAEATLIGPSLPSELKPEQAATPPKIAAVVTTAPTLPAAVKPGDQRSEAPASDQPQSPPTTGAIPAADPASSDAMHLGAVGRTEFGVDLGGAKSIDGLRALWRGATKSNPQQLASLQPIIVIKERNDGFGMQLRLVAGPLSDAAAAAKICANLTESSRACATSVYEGQRLGLQSEKKPEAPVQRSRRRSKSHVEQPAEKPKVSSFTSFFGGR